MYLKVKVFSFDFQSPVLCAVSHAAGIAISCALSWTLQSPQQLGNQAYEIL